MFGCVGFVGLVLAGCFCLLGVCLLLGLVSLFYKFVCAFGGVLFMVAYLFISMCALLLSFLALFRLLLLL